MQRARLGALVCGAPGHRERRLEQLHSMEKRLSELSASAQSERGSLARAQNVAFLSEAVQCLSEQMETSAPFDQELRAVEQLAARFGGDDGQQLQAAISQCAAAVALAQKSGSGGGLATRAELASQFRERRARASPLRLLPYSLLLKSPCAGGG